MKKAWLFARLKTKRAARGESAMSTKICAASRPQRVLSTYIVESRISIIGTTLMVWVSVPHIGT